MVDTYSTTTHVPEALHRLVEAYTALGLNDEARKAAAVLGYNFPSSEWYKDSYALARANEKRMAEVQPVSDALPAAAPEVTPAAAAADTAKLAKPPQPETSGETTIIPAAKKKKPWYQFW